MKWPLITRTRHEAEVAAALRRGPTYLALVERNTVLEAEIHARGEGLRNVVEALQRERDMAIGQREFATRSSEDFCRRASEAERRTEAVQAELVRELDITRELYDKQLDALNTKLTRTRSLLRARPKKGAR